MAFNRSATAVDNTIVTPNNANISLETKESNPVQDENLGLQYQRLLPQLIGLSSDPKVREAWSRFTYICKGQWENARKGAMAAKQRKALARKRSDLAHQLYEEANYYNTSNAEPQNANRKLTVEMLKMFQDHRVLFEEYTGEYSLYDYLQLATGRPGNPDNDEPGRIQGGLSLGMIPGFNNTYQIYAVDADPEGKIKGGYLIRGKGEDGEPQEANLSAEELRNLLSQNVGYDTAPATYECVMEVDRWNNIPWNGYRFRIRAGATCTDIDGYPIVFPEEAQLFGPERLIFFLVWGTVWGRSEKAKKASNADKLKEAYDLIKRCLGPDAQYPRNHMELEYVRVMQWFTKRTAQQQAVYFQAGGRLFGYKPEDMVSIAAFSKAYPEVQKMRAEYFAAQREKAATPSGSGGSEYDPMFMGGDDLP